MARTLLALAGLLAVAAVAAAAPKSLPSTWPTCKKTDPKLGECVRDAVHVAVRDLAAKGAKEFGVFPIEPLMIKQLDIDQGTGPVSIKLNFKDLQIYGLAAAHVGVVKAEVDKYHFVAPLTLPDGVHLKGQYKIDGKVLVLPIKGEGACDLKLSNITGMVELVGKQHKVKDVVYMTLEDFKFTFDTTRLQIKLENLFNGNKQLSDSMNVFLNENWADILGELKPAIQQAFGAAFGDISNRIFRKVPYHTIFKD